MRTFIAAVFSVLAWVSAFQAYLAAERAAGHAFTTKLAVQTLTVGSICRSEKQ